MIAHVRHTGSPPDDPPTPGGHLGVAVAIPARNESNYVAACLAALAGQRDAPPFEVVVLLNNCTDDTAERVAEAALAAEGRLRIHVWDIELARERSDAAWARRLATNAACGLVRPGGIVMTTDADSQADPGWVSSMLAEFEAGADVVCGFVTPDVADAPALTEEAIRRGASEYVYSQLTAEATALIDPLPHDPWPNHFLETGASLAFRAAALRRLGGIPHVCPGEDLRFVELARRAGLKVRHALTPRVVTSSRVCGRAVGGWSADLLARLNEDHPSCHPRLEPANATLRRARLRARLRHWFGSPRFRILVHRITGDERSTHWACATPHFEEAWARIMQTTPLLASRPLPMDQLPASIARLSQVIARSGEGQRPHPAPVSRARPALLGDLR